MKLYNQIKDNIWIFILGFLAVTILLVGVYSIIHVYTINRLSGPNTLSISYISKELDVVGEQSDDHSNSTSFGAISYDIKLSQKLNSSIDIAPSNFYVLSGNTKYYPSKLSVAGYGQFDKYVLNNGLDYTIKVWFSGDSQNLPKPQAKLIMYGIPGLNNYTLNVQ